MVKKTLGQHLEDGLTHLAERGYQIQQEKRELEETLALGLIPDTEKLRLLKQDLYRKVRSGGEVSDLVSAICRRRQRFAIAALETSVQLEFQRNNTLEAVVSRFVTSVFLVGIAAVTFSFPVTYLCGHSQAPFCRNARALADSVVGEFQEPHPIPAYINP